MLFLIKYVYQNLSVCLLAVQYYKKKFFFKKKINLKKWMEEKLTAKKELFEIQVSKNRKKNHNVPPYEFINENTTLRS